MVLDKFHVLERRTRAVGQRHAVTGLDGGIGGERKNPAATAGGQDDGLGGDGEDFSCPDFDGHHAPATPLLDQQPRNEAFIVALDDIVFQAGLEKGVQHVETGLVSGEPGALDLHSAEGAHRNAALWLPAPGTTPVLQLQHLAGRFFDKCLHRVLIAHPVAAGDGVVGVLIQAVVGFDDGGGTALGRDGVAPHGIHFGDYGRAKAGIHLRHGDGRAQARPAAAHHQHVTRKDVHRLPEGSELTPYAARRRQRIWRPGSHRRIAI